FFPLGYLARPSLRRIRDTLPLFFAQPRYVKPARTLRRTEIARATKK
ncbi:cellulose biosynthesis protein BcsF, partial [Escherichia coli]